MRYKTPQELCAYLRELGVDARLARKGLQEERITTLRWGESLGVINIEQSPIGWVNIVIDTLSSDNGNTYETLYVMPASRPLPELTLSAVRVKTFPLFGKVTDVEWKPDDNLGIARDLTQDKMIKSIIMRLGYLGGDPCVLSWNDYWMIRPGDSYGLNVPLREEWSLYEKIAEHLPYKYPKPWH